MTSGAPGASRYAAFIGGLQTCAVGRHTSPGAGLRQRNVARLSFRTAGSRPWARIPFVTTRCLPVEPTMTDAGDEDRVDQEIRINELKAKVKEVTGGPLHEFE